MVYLSAEKPPTVAFRRDPGLTADRMEVPMIAPNDRHEVRRFGRIRNLPRDVGHPVRTSVQRSGDMPDINFPAQSRHDFVDPAVHLETLAALSFAVPSKDRMVFFESPQNKAGGTGSYPAALAP